MKLVQGEVLILEPTDAFPLKRLCIFLCKKKGIKRTQELKSPVRYDFLILIPLPRIWTGHDSCRLLTDKLENISYYIYARLKLSSQKYKIAFLQ